MIPRHLLEESVGVPIGAQNLNSCSAFFLDVTKRGQRECGEDEHVNLGTAPARSKQKNQSNYRTEKRSGIASGEKKKKHK